jgi:O-6-methylguanine DNA methyltransferase
MNALGTSSALQHRTVVDTPLGRFAITASAKGLCALAPLGAGAGSGRRPGTARDARAWEAPAGAAAPGEALHLDAAAAALRAYCAGDQAPYAGALDLAGSDFRLRVWRRLLAIPFGGQVTYGALAAELGIPGEGRAVGTAVAANPVAILVPCHRVVGAGGTLRGYAWGIDLKRRLLAHELRIG